MVRPAQSTCSAFDGGDGGDLPRMSPVPEAGPGGVDQCHANSELLPSGEGIWVLGSLLTTHLKTRK